MTTVTTSPPSSGLELFADATLRDPYPAYAQLRSLGPVVRLERYDALAVTGFDAARQVLRHWQSFSSAHGLGLNAAVNALGRPSVLMSDPPRHGVLRGVLIDRLGPQALRGIVPAIETRADELVAELVGRGRFDAVVDLARVFPVEVVGDLIGLPRSGREELLELADGTFNSFGPDNERSMAGMAAWQQQAEVIARIGTRDRLAPDSLGMAVYEAADTGVIDAADCLVMLGTYLNAGMDTTINAIGAAVLLLAKHPVQWEMLRADPTLAAAAFEEALRVESPVQSFSRLAVVDDEVAGVPIATNERVLVLFGCANRDERRWARAADFDIGRPTQQHLAFGFGIHSCAGQALARFEGVAILRALARQVARLEVGEEVWHLNNVIRGLNRLPVAVTPT